MNYHYIAISENWFYNKVKGLHVQRKGAASLSNIVYKIINHNNERISASLIYVSKARYEKDWHSTMHSHPFTELFYVVKGSGNFLIEDKTFHVVEDDLVIVNANVVHTESSKDANPLEYIVLGIEGLSLSLYETGRAQEDSFYSFHNYRKHREEILTVFQSLISEVEKKEDAYEVICQNYLNILLLNLVRRTKAPLRLAPQKNTTKECTYIKNYIDIHYSEPITLDTLANETYLDKYYLVHVFKKHFDTTPIHYLIDKRIDESKHLLETTHHTVSQISNIVGFNSQSYFTQTFRKKMGCTPAEYRKRERKSSLHSKER